MAVVTACALRCGGERPARGHADFAAPRQAACRLAECLNRYLSLTAVRSPGG